MSRAIVIDTETTGGSPRKDGRIVEIGMVETIDHLPTGRVFHAYVDPERNVDWGAERVHGLTRNILKGCPSFKSIAQDVKEFMEDATLLAHGLATDQNFIEAEFIRAGVDLPPSRQWKDTIPMCRKLFGNGRAKLDMVAEHFEIETGDRKVHGALLDAVILAAVVARIEVGETVDVPAIAAKSLPLPGPLSKKAGKPFGKGKNAERQVSPGSPGVKAPKEHTDADPRARPTTIDPKDIDIISQVREKIESLNERSPSTGQGLYDDFRVGRDEWSRIRGDLIAEAVLKVTDRIDVIQVLEEFDQKRRDACFRMICRGMDPDHVVCMTVDMEKKYERDVPNEVREFARLIEERHEVKSLGF